MGENDYSKTVNYEESSLATFQENEMSESSIWCRSRPDYIARLGKERGQDMQDTFA